MARKLLIGCYEIPGYSGTTAAYQLFEIMLKDGWDAHYVNIIDEQDIDFFRYEFGRDFGNPKGLPNTYCIVQGEILDFPDLTLASLITDLSPDLSIGVGHIAALLLKRASADRAVIFMTHGCRQLLGEISQGSVKDFLTRERQISSAVPRPDHVDRKEREAVGIADFVIPHSESTKLLYNYFFADDAAKISSDVIWFGEWIYEDALNYSQFKKPFAERDIDLLFVSGSWSRPEKNYALVRKLVSSLRGLNIHVVGEAETRADEATYHGLIVKREDLFSLLGRTRALVCPSLFDAAPGILFEGSAMDCNLVASRNCGNWQICNERLLVDPFAPAQFIQKTALSVSEKFDDNMSVFLKTNSYQRLLATLSLF